MIATPSHPILSVIIPVRNQAGPLGRLLDRLRGQAMPPDWQIEVIVVDNGSTDLTAAVIKASPFTYVLCAELGAGAARNAGVRASRGSLIYFMDADTLPGSDEQFVTVTQIASRIGPGNFGAFGGAVVLPPSQRWNPVAIADHWACWFNWHPGRKPQRTKLFQPGLSLVATRRAFDAVGGFDNSLAVMQDMEFQHRLMQHGFAIYFTPRLVVMHEARGSPWRSWRHSWSWGGPFRERYLPTAPDYGLKYPLGDPRFFRNLVPLFRRRFRMVTRIALSNAKWQAIYCYPFLAATIFAWAYAVVRGKEHTHGTFADMTSLDEELAEQSRWRARAKVDTADYDALVANEFDTPEGQLARVAEVLKRVLRISARHVPFYRERFANLGLDPDAPDPFATLSALPVLRKEEVQEHAKALVAEEFPEPRDRIANFTVSSGTTGRPTRVSHSEKSWNNFGILKQREYRWFRFDPAEKLVSIRLASQLPRKPDGFRIAAREILMKPEWSHLGEAFETGPHLHCNVINPVENQLRLLREQKPRYLLAYPESLEHLAFAAAPEPPAESIQSVLAVSEQLTPGMRRHIARSFNAPIQQNYGLNEIGLVAVRCAAGRYHVHTEHCHVEILDDAGNALDPEKLGRIIVTSLSNTAMPLLRYDSGDLAQAVDGDCSCGRTLPAFGEVVGRYSRIAFLPEGTLGLVGALTTAIEEIPAQHAHGLRQVQVHQYLDNRFELRLAAISPLPPAFAQSVRSAWALTNLADKHPLEIVEVSEIARPPGGKFQVFTSDFMPALKPDDGA